MKVILVNHQRAVGKYHLCLFRSLMFLTFSPASVMPDDLVYNI